MKFLWSISVLFIFACSYQIKIKTGDQAFQSKQYAVALSMYRDEFEQSDISSEKAYKAFKIGQCNNYISDYGQSLKWFKKAYDLNYGLKALEEYAFALKNNGEYEAAISAFQELSEELKNTMEFRKEINICKLNLQWKFQESEYFFKLTNLKSINERSSDYSGVLLPNGKLYFVSDRLPEQSNKQNKYAWTGRFFSDIFVKTESGITSISKNINSEDNEGPFCFDLKMSTIYFTRCSNIGEKEDFCNIYFSTLENGSWSEPEIIDFGLGTSNQLHPALHNSDSILIFSSDAKNGMGQFDLYSSKLTVEGWSEASNLGETLNSPLNEKFPVWYKDTLFFSSNGHPGMGGLDVFKTYRFDNKWTPPINLKPTINSEADDFGFFVDTSFVKNDSVFMSALLSSNRGQANNDEIYKVELLKRQASKPQVISKKFTFEIIINIQFVSHELYKNNKTVSVDSVELIEKLSRTSVNTKNSNKLSLRLLPAEKYTFLASRKNYLNHEFFFTTPERPVLERDSIHIMNIDIEMLPLIYDTEFILQELYYDFDQWAIREDAIPSLEKLKLLLITNPGIKILLGSHTDCRGEETYNKHLSAKRAQSAIDWLIARGISTKRLFSFGYGETDLSIDCACNQCTEEQHQLNRRTTFKIIQNN